MRLHVEVEGSGPVVLLGHGFAGSARNLRPQARALRASHRVVRFDARGHARSDAPDDAAAYSVASMTGDVGAVLDEVAAPQAVVGGVSMGAALALLYALDHPERVCGVVVASHPAGAGGRGLGAVAGELADAIERDGLEAAGARFVWGPESGLDAAAARLVRQGYLEHRPHALAHVLRGVIARLPGLPDLRPRLAALGLPVLLVAGSRDAGALAAHRALAEALPRARVEVIEGAGHLVNLERAADVNRVLLGWLADAALSPTPPTARAAHPGPRSPSDA